MKPEAIGLLLLLNVESGEELGVKRVATAPPQRTPDPFESPCSGIMPLFSPHSLLSLPASSPKICIPQLNPKKFDVSYSLK